MKDQRSPKGVMLTNIRNALINPTDQPYPQVENIAHIYQENNDPLDIRFATALTEYGSHFIFCENRGEMLKNLKTLTRKKRWDHLFCRDKEWQEYFRKKDFRKIRIGSDLEKADAGITTCEVLVARTGSVVLSSAQANGRSLAAFPQVHIVLAHSGQLVPDIKDALQYLRKKYEEGLPSMISLGTGPSRTADIEKTLVMGAHGPEEVYVFLLDNPTA